jgi:hypothetical protein
MGVLLPFSESFSGQLAYPLFFTSSLTHIYM